MDKNTKLPSVYCPFCGHMLQRWYYYDDGVDYYGHARGTASSGIRTEECCCQYSKRVKIPPVKPMCVNCKYYNDEKCTNEKLLKRVVSFGKLQVTDKIEDVRDHCMYYELNSEIFTQLIDKDAANELDLCD